MKNAKLLTVIEKNRLNSDQPFLFALEVRVWNSITHTFVDTLRFVQNDEDVMIDGQSYQALPFDVSLDTHSDSVPRVNVVIQDQLQIVQGYMQAYKGGIDSDVRLMIVTGTDKDSLESEIELSDDFIVTQASAKDYVVTWELGVDNPLNRQVPARILMKNVCSFAYRGVECTYSGALPSCDLSLTGANGCRAHNNEANYGGAPGIIVRG